MLYCDEYDKDCSEVTSEECDNGCCDSCMYCVVCTDDEWNEDLLWKRGFYMKRHIIYSPEKVIVTRNFYNYMQDVLAMGYVEEFIYP